MSYTVRIADSEVVFACDVGQSVLDAALRANIELPYSCRKGVCGSCAGGVVDGQVTGVGGAAIRNEVCLNDDVLYCMSAPTSDLVLHPVAWKRQDPSARKRFTTKVYRNHLAAPDVSILQLRLPVGQRAKFQAGQYLQLELDDGSKRCYSMANAPHESDGVTLHIRHVAGGRFSGQVQQLQPGTVVCIELPFGGSTLHEESTGPLIFVAGGTGFAPVKSILDDMLRRRIQRSITLIWGAREWQGLYWRAAVQRWQKQWPDFRFIPALSGGSTGASSDAFAGRVDDALRASFADLTGHEIYCCGSPVMVKAVRDAAVRDRGLASTHFHADVFVPGPAEALP